MACSSQLRSLMKKNGILWYRHICWSLTELLFPVLLFAIILIFRTRIEFVEHGEEDFLSYVDSVKAVAGKPYYESTSLISDIILKNKLLGVIDVNTPFASCIKANKSVLAFVNANSDAVSTTMKSTLTSYFSSMASIFAFSIKDFTTEADLETYVKDLNYGNVNSGLQMLPSVCAAVVRQASSALTYLYDVRMDDNTRSNLSIIPSAKTTSTNILGKNPNTLAFTAYQASGYTYLQSLITNTILRIETGLPNAKINIGYVPMKSIAYTEDTFLSRLKSFMPMFVVLMYIVPIFRMISLMVGEKETKIRESMKMMGLKDSTYWLSWILYFAIIIFAISIIVTVICSTKLFKYSSFISLWLFFFLYGLSTVTLCMFIASIFNKSRVASIVGSLIYFGTYFVSLVVSDDNIDPTSKYASSLLPTVCVSLLTNYLVSYESTQTAITFTNMQALVSNYSYSVGLVMLVVDFFIFLFLALYLDNVLPKDFGIKRAACFFFSPKYWRGKSKVANITRKQSLQDVEGFRPLYNHPEFEEADNALRLQEKTKECLKIVELSKSFGSKSVVENLTVTMYKNQIFVLLGHNGAGKTTTISMLTGLLEKTKGYAFIDGLDVLNDLSYFRKILGICPQHNVLFEDLTPKEHLKMFATFKGSQSSDEEISKMIIDMGLLECQNTKARNLSGGMKRKLSIGIAFIGGSKVILLDEPTSGMDLTARRKVWEMLKNYKSNRVIILTTHYMDEADYLGDRIGIMSEGKLICLGTSFFLKKKFGIGYNLTVVLNPTMDKKELVEFVSSKIPTVVVKDEGSTEIHFQFDFSDKFPERQFPSFFRELDAYLLNKPESHYGVSATTLEDVFMNTNAAYKKSNLVGESSVKVGDTPSRKSERDVFKISNERIKNTFSMHLGYGIWKRFKNLSRNLSGLLLMLFVPILLMIVGLSLTLIKVYVDSPLVDYNASRFPVPQDIIINDGFSNIDDYIGFAYENTKFTKYTIPSTLITNREKLDSFNNYLLLSKVNSPLPYRYGSIYVDTFDKVNAKLTAVLFINITSTEAVPAFTQMLIEQALKAFKPNLNVTIRNSPLPLTLQARSQEQFKNSNQVSFMYNIAFAIIPAIIVSFIVQEKEGNLKHQQIISGMSVVAYWVSNFIYDLVFNMVLASIGIGLLYAYSVDITYSYYTIILYETCVISFTYASSFLFKSESLALNITLGLHMFCGILLGPVFLMLRQFSDTQLFADIMVWPLRLIPSFAFSDALLTIPNVSLFALSYKLSSIPSSLDFHIGGGGSWMFMGIDFVLCWIIIALVESRVFLKHPTIKESKYIGYFNDETDVNDGEESLQKDSEKDYSVYALCLRKQFKTGCHSIKTAVQKVSIGLKKGEVFALLGTNGAGKSTTFKMITYEIMPTCGKIFINGQDIFKSFNQVRQSIGYCPQFDTIFPYLTVYENLVYYAAIKNILPNERKLAITSSIHKLSLDNYIKIEAGKLSGGNKRKLSVAIAMMGNPSILLLDEPSTGMDPEARRFMWTVISNVSTISKECSVIITTHSMEEAEALSKTIGIMVNGKFRCLGSAQHIKSKYGEGYELYIRAKQPSLEEIKQACETVQLDIHAMLDLEQIKSIMGLCDMSMLIGEIHQNGSASDFNAELVSGRQVKAEYLLQYILTEKKGIEIERSLLSIFEKFEQLEHFFATYKYKVPRTRTLAEIFELLCKLKDDKIVSEYSVSQTTLEQIFNSFAMEENNTRFRKISK